MAPKRIQSSPPVPSRVVPRPPPPTPTRVTPKPSPPPAKNIIPAVSR